MWRLWTIFFFAALSLLPFGASFFYHYYPHCCWGPVPSCCGPPIQPGWWQIIGASWGGHCLVNPGSTLTFMWLQVVRNFGMKGIDDYSTINFVKLIVWGEVYFRRCKCGNWRYGLDFVCCCCCFCCLGLWVFLFWPMSLYFLLLFFCFVLFRFLFLF